MLKTLAISYRKWHTRKIIISGKFRNPWRQKITKFLIYRDKKALFFVISMLDHCWWRIFVKFLWNFTFQILCCWDVFNLNRFQLRRWQAMLAIWTSTRLSSIWLSMVEIRIFSTIMHTKSSLLPEEVMIISNFLTEEKWKKPQEPWNTRIWLHSTLVVSKTGLKLALRLVSVPWSHS